MAQIRCWNQSICHAAWTLTGHTHAAAAAASSHLVRLFATLPTRFTLRKRQQNGRFKSLVLHFFYLYVREEFISNVLRGRKKIRQQNQTKKVNLRFLVQETDADILRVSPLQKPGLSHEKMTKRLKISPPSPSPLEPKAYDDSV